MIVPVVMVMGGTFAFSAWSGSANATFGQSAATVGYTESLSFVATSANMTPLTIGDGHTSVSDINMTTGPFVIESVSGGAASVVNVYANATNMVPGDWVEFQVVVTNTGTATLNTSAISIPSGSSLASVSELQPPLTTAQLNSAVATGYGGWYNGWFALISANTASSTPTHLFPGGSFTYDVYGILPSITPSSYAGTSYNLPISLAISVAQ